METWKVKTILNQVGANRKLLQVLIVILTTCIAIDFMVFHKPVEQILHGAANAKYSAEGEWEREGQCQNRNAYLDNPSSTKSEDPWDQQMKWIGGPADCRVKGHLIERLDDGNNFRRGFALRFTDDVEDRTHLLPWLFGTKVDLNRSKRRVLLDLGSNTFASSIRWFLRMYPCDFTEIHAFEVDPNVLRKPERGFNATSNLERPNSSSRMAARTPGVPQWMLDRVRIYHRLVADRDDKASRSINITRFIKEELGLKPRDSVVVKMDVEGSEWPILARWMKDADMPRIVDDLFVEIHYDHPSMRTFHWARFAPITRSQAKRLLADLRWKGFFAHFWP